MTDITSQTNGQNISTQNQYNDPTGQQQSVEQGNQPAQQQYQYPQSYQQGQYAPNYQYQPQPPYNRPPPAKKSHIGTIVGAILVVVIIVLGATVMSLSNKLGDDQGNNDGYYQQQYETLSKETSYLNAVKLDSLAHDFYETARTQYGTTGLDTDGVNFCVQLSKYDRGQYSSWSDIDSSYHDVSGGYRYDESSATLRYVLGQAGVTTSNTSIEKIAAILSFVNAKVDYQFDLDDKYFAPTETLSSGTGDCEDYSILVASLFEMTGIQTAIAFFKNATDPTDDNGHALVLVRLSSLGDYGTYSYSDLTSLGLSSGKWIEIEPQRLISDQYDSTWFPKWSITAAVEA
jgi:predicted transglutaminase-like cysteine proteinase